MTPTCADCGIPIDPRATRCRACFRAILTGPTAERDALVLEMRAAGLPFSRMGRRLGIGRMAALRAYRRAQSRQAARESK